MVLLLSPYNKVIGQQSPVHLSICIAPSHSLGTVGEPQATSCASVVPIMAHQFRFQSLGAQHAPTGSLLALIHTLPVSTPLLAVAWQQSLLSHLNREWASYLVTGIWDGFRIGLLAHPNCQSIVGNSLSAAAHCTVISSFLASQVEAGYTIGPLPAHVRLNIVISRMAVVPNSIPG